MKLRGLVLPLIMVLVSGCSAFVNSIGELESDLIPVGANYDDLPKTLGQPIAVKPINSKITTNDIWHNFPAARLFSNCSLENSNYRRPPENSCEAKTIAYYRYFGNIEKNHDVGEAFSADLMTLGVAELFLTPTSISEKVSKDPYLITVWFSETRNVIAYLIERAQQTEAK